MAHKIGAAAVIADAAGAVLLVRHTYGMHNWELPGGRVEPGESALDAVIREVREETALDVKPASISGVYYDADEDMHHFVFRCDAGEAASVPSPSSPEIAECGYFASELLPRPLSDFTARRIADGLAPVGALLPVTVPRRRWLD